MKELQQVGDHFHDRQLIAVLRESSDPANIDQCCLPIEKRIGDLTDESFLTKAMEDVDTVLHIAGIHWSLPVAKAAAVAGVRRMILVHTTGIYSKYKAAGEEYRQIDVACEEIARRSGMILTILRPTMIYGGTNDGNMVRFIKLVDRFPIIPVVSGARYLLQPVHREDLGRAYLQVLCQPESTDGKQYVLSGEKPILLRDILQEIAQHLGKPAKFFSVPFWMAFAGAWFFYMISIGKLDLREKVQRLVEDRSYPHDDAARDFGYQPMAFSKGLSREVQDYLLGRKAR